MSLKTSHILKLSLLIASSLWLSQADATVMYKKVDKDGKVSYSDKPSDDAEVVTIKASPNLVSPPDMNSNNSQAADNRQTNEANYQVFAIDSPRNDEKVRSDVGSVSIVLEITPQIQPNHSIRLHLDSARVGQDQKIPYFNLRNVERGTHELLAIVIDDDTQQIIQTSKAISFHLLPSPAVSR